MHISLFNCCHEDFSKGIINTQLNAYLHTGMLFALKLELDIIFQELWQKYKY